MSNSYIHWKMLGQVNHFLIKEAHAQTGYFLEKIGCSFFLPTQSAAAKCLHFSFWVLQRLKIEDFWAVSCTVGKVLKLRSQQCTTHPKKNFKIALAKEKKNMHGRLVTTDHSFLLVFRDEILVFVFHALAPLYHDYFYLHDFLLVVVSKVSVSFL